MPTTGEGPTTATAPSRRSATDTRRRGLALRQTSVFVATLAALALIACGSGASSRSSRTAPAQSATSPGAAFAWLRPAGPPADWRALALPGGGATLYAPPGWRSVQSDALTVSAAIGPYPTFSGYLNLTPRQGAERLHGWARFRLDHHRAEDGHPARGLAAQEHLHFRSARGSCLLDDYTPRAGQFQYREIACLLAGHRGSVVLIAAAPLAQWAKRAPVLQQAVSAVIVR